MAADTAADPRSAAVNASLAQWRQGDCIVGEQWFVLRLNQDYPLSTSAQAAASEDTELAEDLVSGLVVVTQTCDIVRSCLDRPFVEVCPLVEVDREKLQEIARGRRPGYALVPGLVSSRLVADLDRTMTVEKPVIQKWPRTPGCSSDTEARDFAQALARKRARFAFPDDFTAFAMKLQKQLTAKHGKNSAEGRGIRALREIRVQASPSWDADSVTLFFWFIRDDSELDFAGKSWPDLLEKWLQLVPATGRFNEIDGQAATLGDLTGADYVNSDRLDLDHLSSGKT